MQEPTFTLHQQQFKDAYEIISLYNKTEATEEEKNYLKTLINHALGVFAEQAMKPVELVSQLAPLGDIQSDDVYRALINSLANVVESETLLNKPALHLLTYLLWNREPVCVSAREFDRLLDIVSKKLELTEESLTCYGQLLDAMVDAGVTGIEKAKLDKLLKKLKKLKKEAETSHNETLIFKTRYNYQAALRLGSNETKAELWRRKSFAFLQGVTNLSAAATSLAGAAVTFGVGTAFALPGAVLNITTAVQNFQEAFHRKPKKGWYRELRNLQVAIILATSKQAFTKTDYTEEECQQLASELNSLIKVEASTDIKLGLIEMLEGLAIAQTNAHVRKLLIAAIKGYHVARATLEKATVKEKKPSKEKGKEKAEADATAEDKTKVETKGKIETKPTNKTKDKTKEEKLNARVLKALVNVAVKGAVGAEDEISTWVKASFQVEEARYQAELAAVKASSSKVKEAVLLINLYEAGQQLTNESIRRKTMQNESTPASSSNSSQTAAPAPSIAIARTVKGKINFKKKVNQAPNMIINPQAETAAQYTPEFFKAAPVINTEIVTDVQEMGEVNFEDELNQAAGVLIIHQKEEAKQQTEEEKESMSLC